MDAVLEETNQVFCGADLRRRKSVSFSNTDDIVEVEALEAHEELICEHEALTLGLDLEEDHEALLRERLASKQLQRDHLDSLGLKI